MGWEVLDDLGFEEGYDIRDLAGKALDALLIRSSTSIPCSYVINHRGKEGKCLRVLTKKGVVSSHRYTGDKYNGYVLYLDISKEFIAKVAKDMAQPLWEDSVPLSSAKLSAEQSFHIYAFPHLYAIYEEFHDLSRRSKTIRYLPRYLEKKHFENVHDKDMLKYLTENWEFTASKLYGMAFTKVNVYAFRKEPNVEYKDGLRKTSLEYQDFIERLTINQKFVNKLNELYAGEEEAQKDMLNRFNKWLLVNAVVHLEGGSAELASICERYLERLNLG